MNHILRNSFKEIAKEIIASKKTKAQWMDTESDDMFQKDGYFGGFDSTEMEFVFSYTLNGQEYVFQLPLEKMQGVIDGSIVSVILRKIE